MSKDVFKVAIPFYYDYFMIIALIMDLWNNYLNVLWNVVISVS